MKKYFSIALILGLALVGCDDTSTSSTQEQSVLPSESSVAESSSEAKKEVKLTDGRYYSEAANVGSMPTFIKFKENGTYYTKAYNGGVIDAGTYEIKDEVHTCYTEYDENDAGVASTAFESEKVITIHSYCSTNYESPIYYDVDKDQLVDFVLVGMSSHVFMDHQADYAYVASTEETPIEIQRLYAENNEQKTLVLYHDGTYDDYIGDGVNGTWTVTDTGYALKDDKGNTTSLTVNSDGTAKYGEIDLANKITINAAYAYSATTEVYANALGDDGIYFKFSLVVDEEGTAKCERVAYLEDGSPANAMLNGSEDWEVTFDNNGYITDVDFGASDYTFTAGAGRSTFYVTMLLQGINLVTPEEGGDAVSTAFTVAFNYISEPAYQFVSAEAVDLSLYGLTADVKIYIYSDNYVEFRLNVSMGGESVYDIGKATWAANAVVPQIQEPTVTLSQLANPITAAVDWTSPNMANGEFILDFTYPTTSFTVMGGLTIVVPEVKCSGNYQVG